MPKGVHNRKSRHPQVFYAQVYGCTREQISRMIREGVNPEDPAAVHTWLETRTRKIVRKARPDFRQAVRGNGDGAQLAALGDNPQAPPERVAGLAEGMQALREAEADLSVRYMNAIQAGEPDAIRFWRDEWTNIFEQLRRVETANPLIQQQKGEAVRLSDVEIFISEMIAKFRAAMDAAPERLAHKLVGLPVHQIIEELKKEHRIILRHLKQWPEIA